MTNDLIVNVSIVYIEVIHAINFFLVDFFFYCEEPAITQPNLLKLRLGIQIFENQFVVDQVGRALSIKQMYMRNLHCQTDIQNNSKVH